MVAQNFNSTNIRLSAANIKMEPIVDNFGQKIINIGNTSLWNLDRDEVIRLFKEEGILLFRGFNTNGDIFKEFTELYGKNFRSTNDTLYGKFAPRALINRCPTLLDANLGGYVDQAIPLHGEMYYQPNPPVIVWLFCANPAIKDGETLVADGIRFFNEISISTKELLSNKKIKYVFRLPKEVWQKAFTNKELPALEEECKSNNMTFRMTEEEMMIIEYAVPAVFPSKCGNHQVYINALLGAKVGIDPENSNPTFTSSVIVFEDNSEIPDDIFVELETIAQRTTLKVEWQKGDILMLDNSRILHGRETVTDPNRSIYVRNSDTTFPY